MEVGGGLLRTVFYQIMEVGELLLCTFFLSNHGNGRRAIIASFHVVQAGANLSCICKGIYCTCKAFMYLDKVHIQLHVIAYKGARTQRCAFARASST